MHNLLMFPCWSSCEFCNVSTVNAKHAAGGTSGWQLCIAALSPGHSSNLDEGSMDRAVSISAEHRLLAARSLENALRRDSEGKKRYRPIAIRARPPNLPDYANCSNMDLICSSAASDSLTIAALVSR